MPIIIIIIIITNAAFWTHNQPPIHNLPLPPTLPHDVTPHPMPAVLLHLHLHLL